MLLAALSGDVCVTGDRAPDLETLHTARSPAAVAGVDLVEGSRYRQRCGGLSALLVRRTPLSDVMATLRGEPLAREAFSVSVEVEGGKGGAVWSWCGLAGCDSLGAVEASAELTLGPASLRASHSCGATDGEVVVSMQCGLRLACALCPRRSLELRMRGATLLLERRRLSLGLRRGGAVARAELPTPAAASAVGAPVAACVEVALTPTWLRGCGGTVGWRDGRGARAAVSLSAAGVRVSSPLGGGGPLSLCVGGALGEAAVELGAGECALRGSLAVPPARLRLSLDASCGDVGMGGRVLAACVSDGWGEGGDGEEATAMTQH